MNFPFYIAKRYLFSKKSHNAINVISAISVCGVALATLALVCTLSVFNGFQDLVATFFTAFDPELKITAVTGKVFDGQEARIEALRRMPEIAVFSESLEENAMVQYKDRQTMAVIKGIEDNFEDLTAIDSILFGRGQFVLHDEVVDYAIPGIELVSILGTGIKFLDPLEIYAPKRGVKVNMSNPASSFNSADLYSSGLVFAVNQQKYDSSYILTSLQFARRLFQYDTEVSSVELKLKPDVDAGSVKSKIQKILGDDFRVQDRYEQQADTFRIMEIEKLISYIFLTFILMIACFNVIGSLSMLIIDKKRMRITESGLPQVVIDQTPKMMRRTKLPIVKAKVGPKVMSLIADESVFDYIPVKKEVKATVSGIYITKVTGVRGPLEKPEGKKSWRTKLKEKANRANKELEKEKAELEKEKSKKKKK